MNSKIVRSIIMHLPEFYGMPPSDQSSKHKADLSYGRPNNELVELVWENGHVLFQGQSSTSSRGCRKNNVSPPNNTTTTCHINNVGTISKMAKFGFLDDFHTVHVPEAADQEDMDVPWLNYPMDDLLPEISAVTAANELALQHSSFASVKMNGKSSFHSTTTGTHPPPRISLQQQASSRDSLPDQDSVGGLSNANTTTRIHNNFGFLNFSHFSRPGRANHVEKAVGESDGKGNHESLMHDENRATGAQMVSSRGQTNNLIDREHHHMHVVKRTEAVPREDVVAPGGRGDIIEKTTVEPIVAASSVCSVSTSAERASNNLKRKRHEITDESDQEGRSDDHDVEEESVGVRKGAPARGGGGGGCSMQGSKRSRAAEVHNLSERRRRDRINEKMRALQELIPNCNKVDKASMLDEAIEYLKTLQLQVQIMSMGAAGLYMPQMVMQPFHASPFSPMGMGMGFGLGMMDLNGGPPRNHPQHHNFMQGPAPHFPFARPSNGFQMFGQHPAAAMPLVLPATVAGPISSAAQLMASPDASNSPLPNQVITNTKNGASGSELLSALAHKKDPAVDVGPGSHDLQHES